METGVAFSAFRFSLGMLELAWSALARFKLTRLVGLTGAVNSTWRSGWRVSRLAGLSVLAAFWLGTADEHRFLNLFFSVRCLPD